MEGGDHTAAIVIAAAAVADADPSSAVAVREALGYEGCCLLASHASCLLMSLVHFSRWLGGHTNEMVLRQTVRSL